MKRMIQTLGALAVALSIHPPTTKAEGSVERVAVTSEVYARAERFLPASATTLVRHARVHHRWIGKSDRFWYERDSGDGVDFVIVDAATGKRRLAFHHGALAASMARISGRAVDARKLPLEQLEFDDSLEAIDFRWERVRWRCELTKRKCSRRSDAREDAGDLVSPDGQWAVFRRGYDLWLRDRRDGSERALTSDGTERLGYGVLAGSSGGYEALGLSVRPKVPVALWSPDSRKVLTHLMDQRGVLDLNLVQNAPPSGSPRPVLYRIPYAMPGDAHKPSLSLVVFDVATGARIDMKHQPLPVTMVGPMELGNAWWSADSRSVFFLPMEEGEKRVEFLAMSSSTGSVGKRFEETGPTYVRAGAGMHLGTLSSGEILWYSERDGWGHLYLYGVFGNLRQLTKGEWKVSRLERVDEVNRKAFFTAVGRETGEDPYQRHLYVIGLDGRGLRLLTPENADHGIAAAASALQQKLDPATIGADRASFSPSGRYFLDNFSRPDLPPTTVLRSAESGKLIAVVEKADVSRLSAGGFSMPEPFSVTAADGQTRIYGTIYRPSAFDPSRKYPIVDSVYPGPQSIVTPKTFMGAVFGDDQEQAIAELGFVVVNIDGRGTPSRSKAFLDVSYLDMAQAGNLEDHIAGLTQLAKRFPYMDLDRVGIYGHSGGGFASARAILAHPEFYKVAVSSSGNHDQRGYLLVWGPTYQGQYEGTSYDAQINARLAANLRGKLFLIHGEMDDNVPMALTMQLVDALVRANKPFDFLLLPNADHTLDSVSGYFTKVRWDYFVRNLLGRDTPENYVIGRGQ